MGHLPALYAIVAHFDVSGNGTLGPEDGPPFEIQVTGYSWGAWTAVEMSHLLNDSIRTALFQDLILAPNMFRFRMGLVDPVTSGGRSLTYVGAPNSVKPYDPVTSYVEWGVNYYQTKGCSGCAWPIPGFFFKGRSVSGANMTNHDKSSDYSSDHAHTRIVTDWGTTVAHATFQ